MPINTSQFAALLRPGLTNMFSSMYAGTFSHMFAYDYDDVPLSPEFLDLYEAAMQKAVSLRARGEM